MQGTPVLPGLSILAIRDLYRLAQEKTDTNFEFCVQCLEVYNEKGITFTYYQ